MARRLASLAALSLLAPLAVSLGAVPAQASATPTVEITATPVPTSTTAGHGLSEDLTAHGSTNNKLSATLYGPFASAPAPTDCTTAIYSRASGGLNDGVTFKAGYHQVDQAGIYQWVWDYDDGTQTSLCGDTSQQVTVTGTKPDVQTESKPSATEVQPGQDSTDTAIFYDLGDTSDGIVIFHLFGPFATAADVSCDGDPVGSSQRHVGQSSGAPVTSDPVTLADPGVYQWVASYFDQTPGGDGFVIEGTCGDTSEQVTLPEPSFSTHPRDESVTLGDPTTDFADVEGYALDDDHRGSISFDLYGPIAGLVDSDSCTTSIYHVDRLISSDGDTFTSLDSPPLVTAGTYQWVAHFVGSQDGDDAQGVCGDTSEQVTVLPATPSISTDASDAGRDQTIEDSATLTGAYSPVGENIHFDLYYGACPVAQPDAQRAHYAAGDLVDSFTVPLDGGTTVSTVGYGNLVADRSTLPPGSYYWVASYDGDDNNQAVSGTCGDQGETSVLSDSKPTISSVATTTAHVGETISDTATLAGGTAPSGTIQFQLYLGDCLGAEVTPIETVDGTITDGVATSGPYTATSTGTYHWVAQYAGDDSNSPADGACNDEGETSTVTAAQPTITTTATSATLGSPISDSAVLAHSFGLSAAMHFQLYAPSDTTCTGTPVFSATVNVAGNGTYSSGPFTPTAVGAYHWVVDANGDASNETSSEPCGTAGETSTISKVATTISGTASNDVTLGSPVSDVVVLAGGTTTPTGSVTFALFGPNDITCSGHPVATQAVPLTGARTITSPAFTPTTAGSYTYVAVYSGDAGNAASVTPCSSVPQVVVVGQPKPTITATRIKAGNHTFLVDYVATGRAPASILLVATSKKTGKVYRRTLTSLTGEISFKGVPNSQPYSLVLTVVNPDGTASAGDLPTVTPGRVPPVTLKVSPSKGVALGRKVTISGTIGEKDDRLTHRTVVLTIDGTTHTTKSDGKGRYSFTVKPTASGPISVSTFASSGRVTVGEAKGSVKVLQ